MKPRPRVNTTTTKSLLDLIRDGFVLFQGLLEPEAEVPACLSSSAMSGAKSPGDVAEAQPETLQLQLLPGHCRVARPHVRAPQRWTGQEAFVSALRFSPRRTQASRQSVMESRKAVNISLTSGRAAGTDSVREGPLIGFFLDP